MIDDDRSFTLTGYRHLLSSFRNAGYRPISFEAATITDRDLILRHDVDFCPHFCLPLASVEAELGWQSVYYVLVTSRFYNVLEPSTKACLNEITRLGHGIGLHFDASAYPGTLQEKAGFAAQEKQILEGVVGAPVRSISFHRPVPEMIGMANDFAGCLHTYQPRFVQEIAYVSDSRGEWRFGHPLDSEAFRQRRAMQLLTHPVWWWKDEAETPTDRLNGWLAQDDIARKREVARNCLSYALADQPE